MDKIIWLTEQTGIDAEIIAGICIVGLLVSVLLAKIIFRISKWIRDSLRRWLNVPAGGDAKMSVGELARVHKSIATAKGLRRIVDPESLKRANKFNACLRKLRPRQLEGNRQRRKAVGTIRRLFQQFRIDHSVFDDEAIGAALDVFAARYPSRDRARMGPEETAVGIIRYLTKNDPIV